MDPERKAAGDLPQSAWLQAGGLAFLALYGLGILAALGWLTSNVREVPPQNRAVVVRLGALSGIRSAGLLLALPRPIDEVVLVPSAETVVEQDSTSQTPVQGALPLPQGSDEDQPAGPTLTDAEASLGNRLTGDAGVVQMDAKVYYSVTDPYEYVIQSNHLAAALDRLITRSIVWVCASRDVDAILVARPELISVNNQLAGQRERLRQEVMDDINRQLARLHAAGTGLGIELRRVDLISRLHPDTVGAFESVLTASQNALRQTAEARTDAARSLQLANQDADQSLAVAQASASERISHAQAATADVVQLSRALRTGEDPELLQRLYRQRMTAVLSKTRSVTVINPGDDAHLIIQGTLNQSAGE